MTAGTSPAKENSSFLGLPAEIRLEIYRQLFTDLIKDLPGGLFADFTVYSRIVDCTRVFLRGRETRDQINKTGLTAILLTCKKVHAEALPLLYDQAEFFVEIDGNEAYASGALRLSPENRQFPFATNLKLTLYPFADLLHEGYDSDGEYGIDEVMEGPPLEEYLVNLSQFLDVIDGGANLRSFDLHLELAKGMEEDQIEDILGALTGLMARGGPIKVSMGEMPEERLSAERFARFREQIKGEDMGRNEGSPCPVYQWDRNGSGK